MSNTPNDRSLDEELDSYLRGDSDHSRHYRTLSPAEVPSDLDAIVLNQANAALNSTKVTQIEASAKTQHAGLRKWRRIAIPMALAASVVLVISILIQPETLRESTPRSQRYDSPGATAPVEAVLSKDNSIAQEYSSDILSSDDSRSPPSAVAPPTSLKESADNLSTKPRISTEARHTEARRIDTRTEANGVSDKASGKLLADQASSQIKADEPSEPLTQQAASEPARVALAPAAPAPTIQSANPATSSANRSTKYEERASGLEEVVVTAQVRTQRTMPAGPRGTLPLPNEQSEADLEREARATNPTAWLEYIRELRQEKKQRAADREWQKFLKAYPQFVVADDDLARPTKK